MFFLFSGTLLSFISRGRWKGSQRGRVPAGSSLGWGEELLSSAWLIARGLWDTAFFTLGHHIYIFSDQPVFPPILLHGSKKKRFHLEKLSLCLQAILDLFHLHVLLRWCSLERRSSQGSWDQHSFSQPRQTTVKRV